MYSIRLIQAICCGAHQLTSWNGARRNGFEETKLRYYMQRWVGIQDINIYPPAQHQ